MFVVSNACLEVPPLVNELMYEDDGIEGEQSDWSDDDKYIDRKKKETTYLNVFIEEEDFTGGIHDVEIGFGEDRNQYDPNDKLYSRGQDVGHKTR